MERLADTMDEVLTEGQLDAVKRATIWYHLEEKDQMFTISGGPGTGKTFLVNYIMDLINLNMHQVRFCTFTGRASLVLWEKGIPATTIHQLIYTTHIEKVYVEKNGKLVEEKKVYTTKKDKLSPLIKLIVVDEISMVSEKILKDLKSFNIKILCLGDHNQLPPVAGKENDLLDKPDVRLTENVRQGEDNMIVQLADHVIQGNELEYGKYGSNVIVAPLEMMTPKHLLKVDQIICNTNKRRHQLNTMIRTYQGKKSSLPVAGDKLVATFNEWENTTYSKVIKDELPIVNGLIGHCKQVNSIDEINRIINLDFIPTFDSTAIFKNLQVEAQKFKTYPRLRKRAKEDRLSNFEFGYAITVHKSQGSEFDSVIMVIDEPYKKNDLYYKLLFTGITRAKKKLIIFI